jgi:hypothetical protein
MVIAYSAEYCIADGYINNLLNYRYRGQETAFKPLIPGRVFHYHLEYASIHHQALQNITRLPSRAVGRQRRVCGRYGN